MNKKQRLAVVLLVIALVLLITSFVIGISIEKMEENSGSTEKVVGKSVGEVRIEVIKSGGLGDNGGG